MPQFLITVQHVDGVWDALTEDEQSEHNASTPMLFCHGTQDPVVPVFMGKAAYEQVRAGNPKREIAWFDYAALCETPRSACQRTVASMKSSSITAGTAGIEP